jgi:hypothetical protein
LGQRRPVRFSGSLGSSSDGGIDFCISVGRFLLTHGRSGHSSGNERKDDTDALGYNRRLPRAGSKRPEAQWRWRFFLCLGGPMRRATHRLLFHFTAIGAIALSFLFSPSAVAEAGSITVLAFAEADASVVSDEFADSSLSFLDGFFGFSSFAVGQQNAFTGNQIGRLLYSFDVFSPYYLSFGPIIEATVELKVFDNFAGSPYETALYGIDDGWKEGSVTWNSQPSTNSGELDSVLASCCGNAYSYDVTSYVQSQVADGDLIYSFQQRGQDESIVGGVRWFQRESAGSVVGNISGMHPFLRIVQQVESSNEDLVIRAPEPTTLPLLSCGLVMLFALAKARAKRRARRR